jgi:hypothetical protein
MIGKRVRLLVNGFIGKHKGKFGKVIPFPKTSIQYKDIYMIKIGSYTGPYHINQFKVV